MAEKVQGTKLQLMTGSTSAVAWTPVAEVLGLTGPSASRERIDVTDIGSTDEYRSWIGSFKDAGEVGFDINYLPLNATHKGTSNGLAALFDSGTTELWRILPGGATSKAVGFSGFVSQFEPGFQVGEQAKGSCAIQLTSAITWPTT